MAKLLIGPGRLSFPKLFEPNSEEFGGKYGCTILLPPDYDFGPLKEALKEAAEEQWGTDRKKWPKLKTTPATVIKKAEEKDLAGYEPGWHFINLSAKDRPGIVDGNLDDVTDPSQAYAGRWVMCSVNAFAWDNKFGKGVSLGLNNVQLRKHDDPFSGKGPAKNDFEEYAEELDSSGADTRKASEDTAAGDFGDTDDLDDEIPF